MSSSKHSIKDKGIYLLPNVLTLMGFFAAFYAIVAAMQQNFKVAAVAILLAMLMDGLDGSVARMMQCESEFGAQLDSLADVVAFGVAPALVLYSWSLHSLGKLGWLVAFMYASCTALRLARFNVQPTRTHFQGLSTTAAAGFIATFVLLAVDTHIVGVSHARFIAVITLLVSLLKVSTIRYHSFKGLSLGGRVPFFSMLMLLLVILAIALDPPRVLFVIMLLYVGSGPVMTVYGLHACRQRRRNKRKKDEDGG